MKDYEYFKTVKDYEKWKTKINRRKKPYQSIRFPEVKYITFPVIIYLDYNVHTDSCGIEHVEYECLDYDSYKELKSIFENGDDESD